MDPALAPLYARVKDRMDEPAFAARLREMAEAFDGLLDDEALALLMLDELGLNDGAFVALADLHGRAEASVRVSVERIEPAREFHREGRAPGRVANAIVRDATGEARLTLWDRDVEKLEDGTLTVGARVTVINARVKEGRFGTELHVGPWTALEVEGAMDPARRKLIADVADANANANPNANGVVTAPTVSVGVDVSVSGTVLGVTPTRPYRKADGTTGFACDLDLQTDGGRVRIVCWDEAVRAARRLKPMQRVFVENVAQRGPEWHTTAETRFGDAA